MINLLSNLHSVSIKTGCSKMKILILNIEKELEAHLSRIRSTHESYKLTQYELQTLTPLDGRAQL